MFAHSRNPHPVIKLWCQVPFTKSKTIFQIEMYCMQCFLKSKYIKSRTFSDKNRWIIKKGMVLKKLLPHLATRGTSSPGDWRCDEAWREQTLVYPPVMCQQRLSYCTWELNVMPFSDQLAFWKILALYVALHGALWECRRSPPSGMVVLTHWGQDKIAANFLTTFSNAFSWMKTYNFRLRFHWSLFPMVQ